LVVVVDESHQLPSPASLLRQILKLRGRTRLLPRAAIPQNETGGTRPAASSCGVTDCWLDGVDGADPIYRLTTTILDHGKAPAKELAALYRERWEIETALDQLKTHLRGSKIVLRSKTPDLVRQEFYGFMMAHFAIRGLMHEAALKADVGPDRLSFVHAVHVVRRKLGVSNAITPSADEGDS
jgi:hypothetical protein